FVFGVPLAMIVVAYMAANMWLCGHPLPISGTIKRSWSSYLFSRELNSAGQNWPRIVLRQLSWPIQNSSRRFSFSLALGTFGVSGFWLVGLVRQRRGHCRIASVVEPWGPCILFGLFQVSTYALLYHRVLSFAPWYYVVQHWLAALLIAGLVQLLVSRGIYLL